jgi:Na+-driven multidrug efflux pump
MIIKLCLNALFIYGIKVDDLVYVELSSIISQASMSIVGCVYIFRKSNIFRITLKELSLKWTIVKKIIIVSFPLFLGKFVMSLGKVTVNAMCKAYGALTVGALGISNNMCGLITSPCLAFEESTSSIVSQNLGNKNMRRCLKVFLVSFAYLMIWMVVGFLVVRVFFMDEIIGLFNLKNDSLEFVNMIKNIFYYDCLTIPALAINCAVLGILYGYGQTFLATINNVIRIVTRISVLWYLQSFHPEIGAEAAGISMGISNVLIAFSALVFLAIFFIKVKVKGYKGMRFSDDEPKMVEVDGMLISEVVLNERNKNLK